MISDTSFGAHLQPPLSGPLTELREKIEDIHAQLILPKKPAEEILLDLQHDFRTPIGNILACVTLIHMDGELTESQMELVEIIEEAATSLIRKLDDLIK